jgi:hypothetical protein
LYGKFKKFEKNRKIYSQNTEVFDLKEVYVDVVDEKLLLNSRNLKANLKSTKFHANPLGKIHPYHFHTKTPQTYRLKRVYKPI